jgi:TMEM175 potassium channel family protein
MGKERLAAFSDGVIAIIITIMVLELKVPHGSDWTAPMAVTPNFVSYVLSFIYLAIYWNNHHHLLASGRPYPVGQLLPLVLVVANFCCDSVDGIPTAVYGGILLMPAIAYYLLQRAILRNQGSKSLLANALGTDIKGKISPVLYAAAIVLAFVSPWISIAIYVLVAVMWLVPDRRIENVFREKDK